MATPVDKTHVGALIASYVRDAEAGRTRDPAGGTYTPAALRSLRRSLDHVEAAAGDVDLTVVDDAGLELLGRQVVHHAGLPQSRLGSIVHALRVLSAYAAGRAPAGPPPTDPLPWADPPRWTDLPPRAAAPRASEPDPAAAPEARTPTFTLLALGARVSAWIERIIVIAFVLTAIGLALELA